MADRYLLESGAPDGYLMEDAGGVLILEAGDTGIGAKFLPYRSVMIFQAVSSNQGVINA